MDNIINFLVCKEKDLDQGTGSFASSDFAD